MAGEIEEPFRLNNFQVDSFHSGSISFGRFENEALCWERRSSFSHNRYLEEVEKCSKPGSVTEKKAYFEAHFRKKGLLGLNSPDGPNETGYQSSENDISERTANDEAIDHITNVVVTHSARLDESVDGSVHGGDDEFTKCEAEVFGASFSEPQFELASDCTAKVDCISEHVKLDENDGAEFRSLLSIDSKPGIETKENIDGETTCLDTSNVPNMVIGLFGKNNANEENSDASLKAEQSSSAKRSSQSTRVGEINSTEKESRNRTITPQFCRSQKVITGRGYHSRNRVKPDVGATKPGMRQDSSRLSFKSDERVERNKEERTNAEIKQLRKSLNFKAIPMPSYYRRALRKPDGNKATASNIKPRKLYSNSTIPGTRLSESSLSAKARTDQTICIKRATKTADPPQASGGMSCHSTVTSDSSASSHARTSKDHHQQQSKAVIRSLVSRTKILDKGKCTSLRKHKVHEDNHITKGKNFDGKQKTRTGRSSFF